MSGWGPKVNTSCVPRWVISLTPTCAADLTVSAYIPERYVPAAEQRMDLYRRIAALRTDEEAAELTDELLDRYGDVPQPVTALLNVALLRASAAKADVSDITQRGTQLIFSFGPQPDIAAVAAVCGMAAYRQRLQLSAAAQPKLTLYLQPKEDALSAAGKLVEELALRHEEPAQTKAGECKEEQA